MHVYVVLFGVKFTVSEFGVNKFVLYIYVCSLIRKETYIQKYGLGVHEWVWCARLHSPSLCHPLPSLCLFHWMPCCFNWAALMYLGIMAQYSNIPDRGVSWSSSLY